MRDRIGTEDSNLDYIHISKQQYPENKKKNNEIPKEESEENWDPELNSETLYSNPQIINLSSGVS